MAKQHPHGKVYFFIYAAIVILSIIIVIQTVRYFYANAQSPAVQIAVTNRTVMVNTAVELQDATENVKAASWEWDFGDNSSHEFTKSVSHEFSKPGTYTVSLTVNEKGSPGVVSISVIDTNAKKEALATVIDPKFPSLVDVIGGNFLMGADNGKEDAKPAHSVTVSDFKIGKYEVTVSQFRTFITAANYRTTAEQKGKSNVWKNNSLAEQKGVNWKCDGAGDIRTAEQDNEPVLHISWIDAVKYCEWLSKEKGTKYSLPTEAQWEYAAKGGKTGSGFLGVNTIDATAWNAGNSKGKTHLVGQKSPNELGLYDMTGNAWEWCSDWYAENYYAKSPSDNPKGAGNGTMRSLRGGGWTSGAGTCNVSFRGHGEPDYRSGLFGFRVVSQ